MKLRLGKPAEQISPFVYGQFIEHILNCIEGGVYDPQSPFADETGVRSDVVQKMHEMSPGILRFPGGTIMCQYHWQDAVGPKKERIRRQNRIWGGELDPSFGTAEFISLCRRIGAEPMLCVNLACGTPEEAANWVEYCNGTGNTYYANLRRSHGYEEPFRVKYWCIGNECYAEPDIGIQNDVNVYCRDAMEFIKWMKLTDRSIETVVVGCDDERWNLTVLEKLHAVTDYFSYHHYSSQGDMGLYGPFAGERTLKERVAQLSALLNTFPETVADFSPWYRFPPRKGKIKLAIDEWGIWDFKPDETYGLLMRYNWRDALWTASVLNLLVSCESIGMANLAQSVNVLAPVVTEKNGSWYQTIAHAWNLYRRRMTGRRINVRFTSPVVEGCKAGEIDAVSIAAAENDDGTIRIAAVNRDFEHDIVLELDKAVTADVTHLECDTPFETCSMEHCCVRERRRQVLGDNISLPKGSITLITLK